MRWRAIAAVACLALSLSCSRRARPAAPPENPQLWLWMSSLLRSPENLRTTTAMIDRARHAGYTGVAFWDVSFIHIDSPDWPDPGGSYLKQGMEYAASRGLKVLILGLPFGYSNEVLGQNPNWAEGMRVIGAKFVVDSAGRGLRLINSFRGVENGDFESGKTGWFQTGDRGIGIDGVERHSGDTSGIIENAPGNGRFYQLLHLTPWRQYHVTLYVKSRAYAGSPPVVEVLDGSDDRSIRMYKTIRIAPTQGWTRIDAAFNSMSSDQVRLFFGEWGGNTGALWFDDVSVEETALVYLIRRPGAPLRVYDDHSVFREGADYNPVRDPGLTSNPQDDYHEPPAITLPAGTSLRPGQNVSVDFYAVQPVDSNRLGLCLSDPDLHAWTAQNARSTLKIAPPGAGIFLQYDEMRQMNSCQACRSRGMTAGQLLAWHVGETLQLYRSVRPDASFYVWSDMFDPYANAHDKYYLVEDTIAGSWLGLPSEVNVMNWNLDHLQDSLKWFAEPHSGQPYPHRQIIAGYYDTHDGGGAATEELTKARGIPGIDGLMYTTWESDYAQMESFADAVHRNWPAYRTSVSK